MDFGDILDTWEKQNQSSQGKSRKLEELYDRYLPEDDLSDLQESEETGEHSVRDLKRMEPEAVLDLHGFTAEEARSMVMSFLESSARSGKQKVLIIHGKGNRSAHGSVLKKVVRSCLEASPYAGRTGTPGRELGGSGAVWVILKKR